MSPRKSPSGSSTRRSPTQSLRLLSPRSRPSCERAGHKRSSMSSDSAAMPEKVDKLADPVAAAAAALDKIAAARVWLLKEKPFFGVLSRALYVEPRTDVRAFRLYPDDRLAVHPLVVLRTPFPALCARLAHISLHAALGGFVRRGERDARKWNLAHDIAIDPPVRGSGLPLGLPPPPDDLPPGSSAEEIFAALPEG